MEAIQHQLSKLEENLSLIRSECIEQYILTAEEEAAVIQHEISQAKKHMDWKITKAGGVLLQSSDIKWSEINFKSALLRANSSKHYELWQKEKRETDLLNRIESQESLKLEWSAIRFFKLMSWTSQNVYHKKLIVHENNKQLISTICFFLSKDERLKTDLGFSPDKGLLIRGKSGLGKTYLIKCAQNNPLRPIKIISLLEVNKVVKNEGGYRFDYYNGNVFNLDDLGSNEATVRYYGTKINWFKEFIEEIYLKNLPFQNLIISTNLNSQEIEEEYGYRVRSRLREMFNVIDVEGEDMRGSN